MGARLAANLLADGHEVVVHNRSAAAAEDLAAAGARVAPSPRAAAGSADVVLVAVRDDPASRAVWTDPDQGLLAGLRPGAVAVECSTMSPGWARELAGLAGRSPARFLEAPMIGSRPQVEARALVHLVGGAPDALHAVEDVLAVSASRVHHCGDVGTAATLKLAVNALLATQVATVAELLGVTGRAGLAPDAVVELLASLPVTSPAAARAGGAMVRGAYAPNFPVGLAAKDLDYLSRLADQVGGEVPMAERALTSYRRLADAGHGGGDLTAIARLFLPTPRKDTPT
jgi:3-hydroxyisobutyrate dehydrogenase